MITVNDFAEAISEYFDEGERTVPEYRGKTEAQVMFELAKRMAIDFQRWISKNNFFEGADFQKGMPVFSAGTTGFVDFFP